jgi:hypothetical protein
MKLAWIHRVQRGGAATQAAESERLAQEQIYGERRNVKRVAADRSCQPPAASEGEPQPSDSA